MPDVIELADRLNDALEKRDAAALGRIVEAYTSIIERVRGDIDALALEIEQAGTLTRGQVMKLDRYKRLIAEAKRELDKFAAYMEVDLSTAARQYIQLGLDDSQALLAAADPVLAGQFRALTPAAVERALGFLDPKGPLYARLAMLSSAVTDEISRAIIEHIALGRNPKVLARELLKKFGMGLTDALRMARTMQLYSYREASRANYIANNDIVTGWQWMATKDGLVCPACLAMLGTIHKLDEKMASHHNCRCSPIPITILTPGGQHMPTNAGELYYNSLSEAEQKRLLGPGRWQALRDGKFAFSDMVASHDDDVYGEMLTAKALKDLIGAPQ